jgi:hypothetical protein
VINYDHSNFQDLHRLQVGLHCRSSDQRRSPGNSLWS